MGLEQQIRQAMSAFMVLRIWWGKHINSPYSKIALSEIRLHKLTTLEIVLRVNIYN